MNGQRIPEIVVVTLAVLALSSLAIMGWLSFNGAAIPDQIDRMAVGAVSALAAILATTRGGDPTGVVVENPPEDPVMTKEAPKKG